MQYPLANDRKEPQDKTEEEQEEDKMLKERSQFLAEALGVQIKTGQEDPEKADAQQADQQAIQKPRPLVLHAKIDGAKDFQRDAMRRRRSPEVSNTEERGGRNKFETEKPLNVNAGRNYRSNGELIFVPVLQIMRNCCIY